MSRTMGQMSKKCLNKRYTPGGLKEMPDTCHLNPALVLKEQLRQKARQRSSDSKD